MHGTGSPSNSLTTASRARSERRPALDALLVAVRSRKVDVVACTKLDRLARSTYHLVTLARELDALGVDLVVQSLEGDLSFRAPILRS